MPTDSRPTGRRALIVGLLVSLGSAAPIALLGAVGGAAVAPAAGCASEPRGFDVRPGVAGADDSLARACRLAEKRCSRCHPLDRVLNAHVSDPADWENYVSRMRRTPGSGIKEHEEGALVRCLVHHSFGAEAAR